MNAVFRWVQCLSLGANCTQNQTSWQKPERERRNKVRDEVTSIGWGPVYSVVPLPIGSWARRGRDVTMVTLKLMTTYYVYQLRSQTDFKLCFWGADRGMIANVFDFWGKPFANLEDIGCFEEHLKAPFLTRARCNQGVGGEGGGFVWWQLAGTRPPWQQQRRVVQLWHRALPPPRRRPKCFAASLPVLFWRNNFSHN